MVKKILGVIVGYVVMFVFIFVTFTVAYLAMGTEGAFQPGSYNVSGPWIAASIVLGIIAAILGGFVCILIGKSSRAALVLAGVVLVLGILMAIPALSAPDDGQSAVRSGEVGNFEAMQTAQQPPWLLFLNPIIGAVGVFIGSRFKKAPAQA